MKTVVRGHTLTKRRIARAITLRTTPVNGPIIQATLELRMRVSNAGMDSARSPACEIAMSAQHINGLDHTCILAGSTIVVLDTACMCHVMFAVCRINAGDVH
jgi:hypothetical protein